MFSSRTARCRNPLTRRNCFLASMVGVAHTNGPAAVHRAVGLPSLLGRTLPGAGHAGGVALPEAPLGQHGLGPAFAVDRRPGVASRSAAPPRPKWTRNSSTRCPPTKPAFAMAANVITPAPSMIFKPPCRNPYTDSPNEPKHARRAATPTASAPTFGDQGEQHPGCQRDQKSFSIQLSPFQRLVRTEAHQSMKERPSAG